MNTIQKHPAKNNRSLIPHPTARATKEKTERPIFPAALRAFPIVLAVGAILLGICTAIAYATPDPDAYAPPLSVGATALTAFIGGILTVRQCGKDTSAFFCGLIGGILLLLCQLLLSLCFSGSREWGLHSSVPVAILLRVGLILTEVLGALAGKPRKDSNRAHHRPPMAE